MTTYQAVGEAFDKPGTKVYVNPGLWYMVVGRYFYSLEKRTGTDDHEWAAFAHDIVPGEAAYYTSTVFVIRGFNNLGELAAEVLNVEAAGA